MIIPVVNVEGQYNHLIVRCLNEFDVESKLIPMYTIYEDLEKMGIDGLAMGGGPQRIDFEIEKFKNLSNNIKQLKVPILGICVTHQLLAMIFGGMAGPAKFPEYGPVEVLVDDKDQILEGFNKRFIAWTTHNDEVLKLPEIFKNLAHSEKCKVQVMRHISKPIFGTQFHPEVIHTENGSLIFKNFIEICRNG